jgi:nucleobase:cation symporter-1, NCS1 family
VRAVDVGPVPEADRTQPLLDLFLIFAAADIVATTLVTGASLVPAFATAQAMVLVVVGSVLGAALVAALASQGPRLGVPSVIAARAALGPRGAALLAVVLYATNFAWIALNNVIAASACARVLGGPAAERAWALGLGLVAAAVVARGPRAVGLADRAAVPLMAALGAVLTVRLLAGPPAAAPAAVTGEMSWLRGLDVVVGYQVSWILMFADYSRFSRSPSGAAAAVFLGLALPSVWLMALGVLAARAVGSADPGAMVMGAGLGLGGAALLTLASVTTNFVNIYLSALAWKSLWPHTRDSVSVWSIGIVGALIALFPGWLDGYVNFVLILGGLLVPVGGILLARFFLDKTGIELAELYDTTGNKRTGRTEVAALAAWITSAAMYYFSMRWGGTLPSLATAIVVYRIVSAKRTQPLQRSFP